MCSLDIHCEARPYASHLNLPSVAIGRQVGRPGLRALADVHSQLHLRAAALPSVPIDSSAFDSGRGQLIAEQLESAVRAQYQTKLRHGSVLIAITDRDMYSTRSPRWRFVFSARDDAGVGVISLARLGSTDAALLRSRVDKLLARHVELLHDHASFNNDPSSVLYENISSVADIDRMTITAATAI